MFKGYILLGAAYKKSATVSTAVNGFSKTGIYPTNPGIFTDAEFAGAEPTDRPMDQTAQPEPQGQSQHAGKSY